MEKGHLPALGHPPWGQGHLLGHVGLIVAPEVPMGLAFQASPNVDPAMLIQRGPVQEGLAADSALAGPLVAVGPLLQSQGS